MTGAEAIDGAIRLLDGGEWLTPHNADLREGVCARRADGTPTMHWDDAAVGFCMGGALYRVTDRPLSDMPVFRPEYLSHFNPLRAWPERDAFYAARAAIERLAGMDHGAYNDLPGLTYPELRALMVRAREDLDARA